MKRITTAFFFLFCSILCLAQAQKDTLFTIPQHQIGIGINKFIKSIFASDDNAMIINYRYSPKGKWSYRTGFDFKKDDSEGGFTQFAIKLGVDRNLKRYRNWNFYYGADYFMRYSNYKNINKPQYDNGIGAFIGVQYFISPHFSISTEPMFYYKYIYIIDKDTFQKDKKRGWSETGFGKIGFVELNFHF
ncbi:hypothetical protein SAMN05421786_102153 [Chryseobacterium ureilyticum]|uniref:Outer membrane protein beta-barrel domain-containing protein n=1 Tax=Chryseobacterium ureilyticum TaxID=373668 RepID=A0A1N7M0B8_9FLAO|nr:hypothetical protein [Chryseobacterium ureilyticum]SIS79550.1 hypothetical protein SAMN05421786_102153 [Chryseobacterium ureilyticum]